MKTKLYIYLFILLTLTYVTLVMLLPTDPSALKRYDITQGQARLLNLTIVIPLVAIWLSALYGFVRFKSYALLVGGSPEGQPLNRLANGLMILAFSLPINAIISAAFNYYSVHNPDLLASNTIIRNYVSLLLYFGAFALLSRGARDLLKTFAAKGARFLPLPNHTAPLLIILSSLFTWLIVSRPLAGQVGQSTYYLPEWLIILTLAIPYLFVWHLGVLATYRLRLYQTQVKGLIYKQAFGSLAKGIGVVVFISIFIQFITTLSAQITRLNLTPVLLLIYLLVILYAVGFGLVARGAKKLKKIEEA